jgi:hypothetical protein
MRAGADISAGGDREPHASEAENELIGPFAPRHSRTLAQRVTNVAKYEQIAGRGAGEFGEIIRLAGHQPAHEMPTATQRRCGTRIGRIDPRQQNRIERESPLPRQRDKTLGEFDIAVVQRGFNFLCRPRRRQGTIDHLVGKRHRIVGRGQQAPSLEAARRQYQQRRHQHDRGDERERGGNFHLVVRRPVTRIQDQIMTDCANLGVSRQRRRCRARNPAIHPLRKQAYRRRAGCSSQRRASRFCPAMTVL